MSCAVENRTIDGPQEGGILSMALGLFTHPSTPCEESQLPTIEELVERVVDERLQQFIPRLEAALQRIGCKPEDPKKAKKAEAVAANVSRLETQVESLQRDMSGLRSRSLQTCLETDMLKRRVQDFDAMTSQWEAQMKALQEELKTSRLESRLVQVSGVLVACEHSALSETERKASAEALRKEQRVLTEQITEHAKCRKQRRRITKESSSDSCWSSESEVPSADVVAPSSVKRCDGAGEHLSVTSVSSMLATTSTLEPTSRSSDTTSSPWF